MSDEKEEKSLVKEAATKAAIDLAKEAYQDGAQPLVQNVGQLLALPLRLLNACFSNLRAALTDHEAMHRALESGMKERWAKIPPSRMVPPPGNVAGPLMLGYAFVQGEGDAPLRDLYEQLLASAMDSETQGTVHPAFVEMIRQMTPVEAKFLHHLSRLPVWRAEVIDIRAAVKDKRSRSHQVAIGHDFPEEVAVDLGTTLDNLERLKIIEVTFTRTLPHGKYAELRKDAEESFSSEVKDSEVLQIEDGAVLTTQLGVRFIRACIPAPDLLTTAEPAAVGGDPETGDDTG